MFPRFVQVEQRLADRSIPDIAGRIRQELAAGFAGRVRPGARIAIGAGSRGISNIATIVKTVVDFWKVEVVSEPFEILFDAHGDLEDFQANRSTVRSSGSWRTRQMRLSR